MASRRKKRSDAGTKRKKYDASNRKLKAFNRAAIKQLKVRANREDFALPKSRREYRIEARQKLLERFVGVHRRCPLCNKGPLLKSRQWIDRGRLIQPRFVCISCNRMKPFGGDLDEPLHFEI